MTDRRGRLASESACDGPLHGLPIGSRLRDAGAVVLGKTAMDEFAYCEPPPTRNPRDLSRHPDGSSGGSAAAVASGMCPLALGSQTLHSTIGPAAACGVVGYKPSFGRWPFDGVPTAPSLDTIGLLAEDAAMVTRAASVLPGWTPEVASRPILGIPHLWGLRRVHTEGWTAFATHLELLRGSGYELRTSPVPWNDDLTWSSVIGDLVNAEFAEVHSDWFDRYGHLYRPKTASAIELGRAVQDDRVAECRERKRSFVAALDATTKDAGIDIWMCPSAGGVARPFEDNTRETWMTRFWSFSGRPTVSIPIFDGEGGLPHGLQLIAAHGRDEQLLQWADPIHRLLQSDGFGSDSDVRA